MKNIIMVLLCFSFLLFADWETDINSIKTNTYNSSSSLGNIDLSNTLLLDSVLKQSTGLGLTVTGDIEGGNVRIEKDVLPNGLQAIANKYYIVKDNTMGYNDYITSRKFGNSNKTNLDTNSQFGDGFFSEEFSLKSIDTVHNHFKNETTDITQTMATQTPTVNKTNDIVLHSTAMINGYLNTTYEDYTFFTLDLSGLGQMLQSWNPSGVVTSNPFENWKFKCNFVPDQQNNPYMYKLYQCMNTFYTQYYGKFIIQICFSMWLVMMLWQKVIGVFNVE